MWLLMAKTNEDNGGQANDLYTISAATWLPSTTARTACYCHGQSVVDDRHRWLAMTAVMYVLTGRPEWTWWSTLYREEREGGLDFHLGLDLGMGEAFVLGSSILIRGRSLHGLVVA